MSRYTGPSLKVRLATLERDEGRCLRCKRPWSLQLHHRHPRQMGGTKEAWINEPANLAWLDVDCHQWVESTRSSAYALGWLVRSGIDKPYQIPLTDLSGAMFFLSEECAVVPLAGPNEAPF